MLYRFLSFWSLCLSGCIALNSCGVCTSKKYTCDADLDSIARRWFKIDSGQQLIFTNNTLADTFTLTTFSTSKTETSKSGGFDSKQIPCESGLYARSAEKDSSGRSNYTLSYQVDTYYPGKSQRYSDSYLNLKGTTCWISYIENDFGITSSTDSTSIIQSFLSPNGLTYPNVSAIIVDSSLITKDRPYKLYVAHDHGLIGYEMYPSHQIWAIKP